MPAKLRQPSLFDWTPPPVVAEFRPADVRGATIGVRISRAVSAALAACGMPRERVADLMTAYLGAAVTKAALDACASPAREDHPISLPRYMALTYVTRDRRLLQLLADEMGWAVIERRHLPLIEVAELREQEDRIKRRRNALMMQPGKR